MTMAAAGSSGPQGSEIFLLRDSDRYRIWRENKLAHYPTDARDLMVAVEKLSAPGTAAIGQIRTNCAKANMSFYQLDSAEGDGGAGSEGDPDAMRRTLQAFARRFGLVTTEAHRSAGDDGIVALEVTNATAQAGYIPYTKRRLSWHTDGYYNYHGPERAIRAMVMHCVRPAAVGGENAYLDPEIAYIRLRDENPEFVEALMHPEAMTIPENREPDGMVRPANTGPVFFLGGDGCLTMRFTARTRNIIWKDDELTAAAVRRLGEILSDDPLIIRYRLSAGQGVICNNVLHNRTGFDGDMEENSQRLIYRARYFERVTTTGI